VRADARIGTEHVISRTSKSKTTTDPAAAFLAEAAEREQTYAEAKALHKQDQQDYAAAVEHLAQVEHDRASTPDDLARARAARDLAEVRRVDSAAQVAKAERARINTDTNLAAALVSFVANVLGITPTVQAFRPSEVPSDLPSAVLVQTKPGTHDRKSGRLVGEVSLHYFRTPLHREAEAGAFQRAAEKRDQGVTLSGGTNGHTEDSGDVLVDVVRLPVLSVLPEVPEVTITDPLSVAQSIGDEMAFLIRDANTYRQTHLPLTGMDTGKRTSVHATASAPAVLGDTREGDVRRLTVQVVIACSDMSGEQTSRAVGKVQGTCLPKVGRIEKADITQTGATEDAQGRPVNRTATVRAVVVAKVPPVVIPDAVEYAEEFDESGIEITHPATRRKAHPGEVSA
jgi:hypothetical protein